MTTTRSRERLVTYVQLNVLFAIGRRQRYGLVEIERLCEQREGCLPSGLSRRQASELIDWLKAQPNEVSR